MLIERLGLLVIGVIREVAFRQVLKASLSNIFRG